MPRVVLSHYECEPLLNALETGQETVQASLDLGLSKVMLPVSPAGPILPAGNTLPWPIIDEIARNQNACFVWQDGELARIRFFSEETNRVYTLYPTGRAPTMLVSGIPMHRIKGTDPYRDTLSKIKAVAPIRGLVLDTATGLGYTAIEAARTAAQVTTIELDPTVLEVCRLNPWSSQLFNNARITQRIGDAYDVVETMDDDSFSCIIHDPPTFSLAGHLYATDFYVQLRRVLKAGGRLFHYIGHPTSKSGRNITRGVVQRLQQAGFRRVQPRPQAFGVVAFN